jgi:hypothetical protein
VGPRADLNDAKKRKILTLTGIELRPLDRRARSQSLYRLRYPGFSAKLLETLYVLSRVYQLLSAMLSSAVAIPLPLTEVIF